MYNFCSKPDAEDIDESDLWTFENKPSGHLYCYECETYIWCTHIAAIVSKLGDSEMFFDDPRSDIEVQIPVFPTLNMFMPAECARLASIPNTLDVRFEFKNNTYFLGFMHPGEGRNTLRALLFDWFTAEFATTELICHAGTHKPAQEAEVRKLMSKESGFLMTRMAIWMENMCPPCIQKGVSDMSEFVPEDERPNPWSKP